MTEVKWIRNLNGAAGPLLMRVPFAAGASQAIAKGQLLSISGGVFVPQSADAAMTAELAVAAEDVISGDRAGRYLVVVPRPGDVFQAELSAAGNPDAGASLYLSGTQNKLAESGSNAIALVVDHSGIPARQGHAASDASGDSGTTVTDAALVEFTINAAASYFAALQG